LEFADESAISVIQSYDIKSIPQSLFKCFIDYDELWGNDLPIPQVHIKPFILNSQDVQLMGKNKTTIKFTKDNLTFIKFFCNQEFKDKFFLSDKQNHRLQIEIIGELGINTYNGQSSKQCVINHIEVIEKNINNIDDIF
jgi:CRISPR/Cas system CSM-associated protein Csm4 (group 5 of RAMP superfamily)